MPCAQARRWSGDWNRRSDGIERSFSQRECPPTRPCRVPPGTRTAVSFSSGPPSPTLARAVLPLSTPAAQGELPRRSHFPTPPTRVRKPTKLQSSRSTRAHGAANRAFSPSMPVRENRPPSTTQSKTEPQPSNQHRRRPKKEGAFVFYKTHSMQCTQRKPLKASHPTRTAQREPLKASHKREPLYASHKRGPLREPPLREPLNWNQALDPSRQSRAGDTAQTNGPSS